MTGMEFANHPVVWIFASAIIVVVMFQAFKFLSMSRKRAKEVGLTDEEINRSIKTGAITAIGPSIGIIIVAVSLISLIGNPLTLMRIGVIGSAPIESVGAQLSAEAAGVQLGGIDFTPEIFSLVVWVLCIGGAGWMIFTVIATPSLNKIQEKLSRKPKGKHILGIVASGAMIAIFGSLLSNEFLNGGTYIFAGVVAMVVSFIINTTANKKNIGWLKEWSLGFSILASLIAVYFIV